ncbi:ABC transporter substrate-binding protein [Paenibacillus spongiae]|uniref:Extracellular solute-binding protein n=1 Tax=Paenibacillus spongiae TaxID=2909671 RepID=A0ABY5SE13_9BACL|nr:extracellular solute-binding protein [Paenibacillus spongiae]UVI32176.1 extracellular solute-binding protein [Paenibacillus spongiae]
MSRRKYVILLLGVFTVCMALTLPKLVKPGTTVPSLGGQPGLQKPPEITNGEGTITTIHVALSMSDAEFLYWSKLNHQFNNSHPEINVKLVNYPQAEAHSEWIRQSQIGSAIDIILMDNTMIREFAVKGFLFPVDDLYAGETLADQLEALTDPLKWNGSLWGVSVDSDPLFVVWQDELLRKAGLDKPPASWSALSEAIASLHASNPELQLVELNKFDASHWTAWLGAVAGNARDAANLSALSEQSQKQLRFLAEQDAGSPSSQQTGVTPSWVERMKKRELLSSVTAWSFYRGLPEADRKQLIIGNNASAMAWIGGRSFVLTAQSEAHEAAKEWIRAMTLPDMQAARYEELGRLPARKSVYQNGFQMGYSAAKPPNWLLQVLDQPLFTPDPGWSFRWERWSELWRGISDSETMEIEEINRLIRGWNGEEESGAGGAADGLQADGKLDD